jgi:hypothetical protein
MLQQKRRGNPDNPPSLTSDAAKGYESALVKVYGVVPKYVGRGRPPTKKQAGSSWEYLQIVKHRRGGNLVKVTSKVIFGDADTICNKLGKHTSYVERTHLTSSDKNITVITVFDLISLIPKQFSPVFFLTSLVGYKTLLFFHRTGRSM